jgi:hypothetical protein
MTPDIITLGPEPDRTGREDEPPRGSGRTPTGKIAVVTTICDEGLTILEWIAHYRIIGADTIYVYTNDNRDGSDALLQALAEAGIIRLRWNILGGAKSAQQKAYRHAFWLDESLWQHEWAAFLDADEFLLPIMDGAQRPLPDYLDALREKYECAAICLNWKWFSGNGAMLRTPGLLFERFTDASAHELVKTIFRLSDAVGVEAHIPRLKPGAIAVDGSGNLIEAGMLKPRISPGYELGQVNHYWNKSFEEYYLKQAKRAASGSWKDIRGLHQFHSWAPQGVPDAYPHEAHIAAVKAEMSRLRALPGVRAAEAAMLDATDRILSRIDIPRLYKRAQKPPAAARQQARRFWGHVQRAVGSIRAR